MLQLPLEVFFLFFSGVLVNGLDDIHPNNVAQCVLNFLFFHVRFVDDLVQELLAHLRPIEIDVELVSFVFALQKEFLELILGSN